MLENRALAFFVQHHGRRFQSNNLLLHAERLFQRFGHLESGGKLARSLHVVP